MLGLEDKRIVSRLEQLICGGKSRKPRSDDEHFLTRFAWLEVFANPLLDDPNVITDGVLRMHDASGEGKIMTNLIQYPLNFQSPFRT
jgi:hypothetical protein